ncbi:MAG: hydantoinase/oxoprolinase family protein [Alphaproteobacteria bacterium]
MAKDPVIGWDVGGAHLKAAAVDPPGRVAAVLQLPCPLWQGMEHLERAMSEALGRLGPASRHALTMTGEMADLFPSRPEGVRRLIAAAVSWLPGAELLVFAGRAGLLAPEQALVRWESVASANWLASAAFAAARVDQGLFVDVGSTTTDIVPVAGGEVHALGVSDHARLVHDELVYTGVVRTPVMAVAASVPFGGERQGLMAELFATMADVHRLNGSLPEGVDDYPAADGGGKSVEDSTRRLARMLGRDSDSAGLDAWRRLAAHLADCQTERIAAACARALSRGVLDAGAPLIGAGCGRFLVRDLARRLGCDYVDFAEFIDAAPEAAGLAATCAPAVAVASLAAKFGARNGDADARRGAAGKLA